MCYIETHCIKQLITFTESTIHTFLHYPITVRRQKNLDPPKLLISSGAHMYNTHYNGFHHAFIPVFWEHSAAVDAKRFHPVRGVYDDPPPHNAAWSSAN
jgi:hypothetical protein